MAAHESAWMGACLLWLRSSRAVAPSTVMWFRRHRSPVAAPLRVQRSAGWLKHGSERIEPVPQRLPVYFVLPEGSKPSPVTGWRGRRSEKRPATQATLWKRCGQRALFNLAPKNPIPPMTPDASPPTAVNQLPRCALTRAQPDPHPNQSIPLPCW
jgi:hypothetical protein